MKQKQVSNWIFVYYQMIQEETVIVGNWIRLLYEKIIEGLENKEFYFDAKKAKRAISFIENYCHHSKGQSGLLKLEVWQKALVSLIFGIVDENGLRRFREIVLVLGRKNGKSLLASAILAYCAYLDDEYGPECYCIAPKIDQAEIVYSCFWQITQQDEELKAGIKSRKNDYYIEENNCVIKKIAFNEKKSDGLNPHICVCDEVASWPGTKGKKMYDVLVSGIGSRKQPMILSCTTSGYENEGIYDELILRGTRFLLGDSKERRLLPVFYMIDDLDQWNDLTELQKANPNLGVSLSVDYLLEEIAIAETSLSKKAEFITKHCCLKQNSASAWLSTKAVERCFSGKKYRFEDFAHSYCVCGIDLSQTTDLTSACFLIEKEQKLFCISHFWMPEERLHDAVAEDGVPYEEMIAKGFLTLSGETFVDYHDVYNWVREAIEKYELLPLMVGYDRYSAQYLITDLQNYGARTDDVYQGFNLHPVLIEMEGIIKAGGVDFGDNDLMKIHLLDSALKTDTQSGKRRLIKISPRARIDGVAALSDAFCVRQKWYDEIGERLKNAS